MYTEVTKMVWSQLVKATLMGGVYHDILEVDEGNNVPYLKPRTTIGWLFKIPEFVDEHHLQLDALVDELSKEADNEAYLVNGRLPDYQSAITLLGPKIQLCKEPTFEAGLRQLHGVVSRFRDVCDFAHGLIALDYYRRFYSSPDRADKPAPVAFND